MSEPKGRTPYRRRAADELTRRVMARIGVQEPSEVVCPREQSSMTPCVARDGALACADDGVCVGCGADPSQLLVEELRKRDWDDAEFPPGH